MRAVSQHRQRAPTLLGRGKGPPDTDPNELPHVLREVGDHRLLLVLQDMALWTASATTPTSRDGDSETTVRANVLGGRDVPYQPRHGHASGATDFLMCPCVWLRKVLQLVATSVHPLIWHGNTPPSSSVDSPICSGVRKYGLADARPPVRFRPVRCMACQ